MAMTNLADLEEKSQNLLSNLQITKHNQSFHTVASSVLFQIHTSQFKCHFISV